MKIFLCCSADDVSRQSKTALLMDSPDAVRLISQKLEAGDAILKSWILAQGGNILNLGNGQGAFQVDISALAELEKTRETYLSATGSTLSVGIAHTIAQATKALTVAADKGNSVSFYSKELEPVLQDIVTELPKSRIEEISKRLSEDHKETFIKLAALEKAENDIHAFAQNVKNTASRMASKGEGTWGGTQSKVYIAPIYRNMVRQKAFTGPLSQFKEHMLQAHKAGHLVMGRADLTAGRSPEDLEEIEDSRTVHPLTGRETHHVDLIASGMQKSEALNAPAHVIDYPVYEQEFRRFADIQSKKDMQDTQDNSEQVQALRGKVADALNAIRGSLGVLGQLRDAYPDAYTGVNALISSVIDLGRHTLGQNDTSTMQASELEPTEAPPAETELDKADASPGDPEQGAEATSAVERAKTLGLGKLKNVRAGSTIDGMMKIKYKGGRVSWTNVSSGMVPSKKPSEPILGANSHAVGVGESDK